MHNCIIECILQECIDFFLLPCIGQAVMTVILAKSIIMATGWNFGGFGSLSMVDVSISSSMICMLKAGVK